MSSETIPEWARLEGERRAMELVPAMALTFDHSHGLKDYDQRKAAELPFRQIAQHEVGPAIANALLAAEQRGRKAGLEEAAGYAVKFARAGAKDRAEMQDKRMLNLFVQMEAVLPAAIRSLGEKT